MPITLNIFQPLRFFLLIFGALLSCHALSEESAEDWFQIEYVIFEHLESEKSVLRYEDVKYQVPVQQQYQHLYSLGDPMSPYHLPRLEKELSDLNEAIANLKRSNAVRVLDSGAWQQIIPKESQTTPLKIAAGANYLKERHQLEGSITIRRSRYMHADVDLFLNDFYIVPYTDIKDWFFESEDVRWPVQWIIAPLAFEHPVLTDTGKGFIPYDIVHLKHSRRIKDTEIHYIDHPALGLIVTIKKIDDPNALEEEYGELN